MPPPPVPPPMITITARPRRYSLTVTTTRHGELRRRITVRFFRARLGRRSGLHALIGSRGERRITVRFCRARLGRRSGLRALIGSRGKRLVRDCSGTTVHDGP